MTLFVSRSHTLCRGISPFHSPITTRFKSCFYYNPDGFNSLSLTCSTPQSIDRSYCILRRNCGHPSSAFPGNNALYQRISSFCTVTNSDDGEKNTEPKFEVDAHTGIRIKGPTSKKNYSWESLKSRHKRAGNLLNQLNLEGMIEAEKHRPIPFFRSGDAIQVTYKRSANTERNITVRGMVIGRHNRGLGSSFKIAGVLEKQPFELTFPLYSPLIQEIRVIQNAYLHRGKKKVRRSKLYYVEKLPQKLYDVKDNFTKAMFLRQEYMHNKKMEERKLKSIGDIEDEIFDDNISSDDEEESIVSDDKEEKIASGDTEGNDEKKIV